MQWYKTIFLSLLLVAPPVFSKTLCFIVKEKDKILTQEGKCDERHSPFSTFKIALSLIGYDTGILIDASHPEWPYKPGYTDWLQVWEQSQTPTTWIQRSVIWYSQVLTTKLGLEKFRYYVALFNYGNKDVSGDPGENNGLTRAWLDSSLQISGVEQVAFIQSILEKKFPLSDSTLAMTKKILYIEDLGGGWTLYGKSGTGNEDDIPHAWFVGWVEKGKEQLVFAHIVQGQEQLTVPIAMNAKDIALSKLGRYIAEGPY